MTPVNDCAERAAGPASPMPVLTVAMPCYNVARYLERGLTSFDDARLEGKVELIVVDDGSTDDTAPIAESFVSRRPGVFRLLQKENGGHGSAVNAGLAHARGAYFRVVDGDDWVDTAELVRFAELLSHASTDLVVDVKTEVDMATLAKSVFPQPMELPQGAPCDLESVCMLDSFAPNVMIHTLTARTSYLRSIGLRLLEKTFYEDLELVVKATLDAADVTFVDTRVYQYLVGNAGQSVADEGYVRRWDDHARVCEELLSLESRRAPDLSPVRLAYLRRRCSLLSNTHYNIALIFDKDRKRGLRRARAYRAMLRAEHPDIARLSAGHYRKALFLHVLGIDSQKKLDSLRR